MLRARSFRLATYATWWIKAAIQEYNLRSWSMVKMGTTANQRKMFFNLRKAKSKISVLDNGDMRPDQVKIVARRLGVTQTHVMVTLKELADEFGVSRAPSCRSLGTVHDGHERSELGRMQASRRPNQR
jgi:RNA polymerase sigma-32 factor